MMIGVMRLFCLFLCLLCLPATADTTVKRLAPGILFTQEVDKTTPLVIDVVDVDLHAPGVHVGVGIAQDKISGLDPSHGRESVSRYARRHGTLVAINADFFPFTGDPLGVGIKDGELFSEPWAGKGSPRAAIGIGQTGRTVLLDTVAFQGDLQAQDGARFPFSGVNRVPGPNEIVVDLPVYGLNAAGRPNGASVTLLPLSGPMHANTLLVGRVQTVAIDGPLTTPIDPNGAVLCAGPGTGRDFLNLHVHPGEKVGFVAGVAPPGFAQDAIRVAAGDLPSRGSFSRTASLWTTIRQAVGGGPRLLRDGQTAIDGVAEGFDASFTDQLNPRTAVGVSQDGRHLILITVDGRQAVSRGVTLSALAAILKRYGAWNAINLDGGGSTTMSVAGLVMGDPNGEGAERPVADMLTIDSDAPSYVAPQQVPAAPQPPPSPQDPGDQAPSMEGNESASPTDVAGKEKALMVTVGQAVPLHAHGERILWQGMVTGGVGFVTQKGYFLAERPGVGVVTALVDGRYRTQTVSVVARNVPPVLVPSYSLTAALTTDTNAAPNRSIVHLHIADKSGRPRTSARVDIAVTDGVPDAPFVVTDEDGSANTGVTWNNPLGGSVSAQAVGAGTAVVARPTPPETPASSPTPSVARPAPQ